MRIIKKHICSGKIAAAHTRNAPKAILSFELRRRSRQKITLDTGEEVGLALKQGTVLNQGDLLLAEDGQFIMVESAQEAILRVTANTPTQLARAAYHLGNRHILLEVGEGYLQLEHDPVLINMLNKMEGIAIEATSAPFEPETGAYGGGHKHGHDATFEEDYALAQTAYAAHEHSHDHDHPTSQAQHHGHPHTHHHDGQDNDPEPTLSLETQHGHPPR